MEKGLNKLRINLAGVNPTHKIELEVCLALQVESQHAVSHFKHPSCTVLEFAKDLGNTMHESLKRTSQWSAYYFTHRRSYYPLPENSISLRDIPKMSPMPPKEMSQADHTLMREWAQEHGEAVRQLTLTQCTTKHNAGTPLECVGKGVTSLKPPVKTRNTTLVLARKKENQQKTKEKIPLTSTLGSTFYQDQFALALVELFVCHIEL